MRKAHLIIETDSVVFDTCWNPVNPTLLSLGNIDGGVSVFNVDATSTLLFSSKHHKESCRSLDFSLDGSGLFTVSKDRSLQMVNLELEKVVLQKAKAHGEPINKVKALTDNLIATGDDAGCLKIWDLRSRKVAQKYKEHSDFISDIEFVKNTLVVTSGDGCLSVYDPRKSKAISFSANQDDELLSVAIVRNTTKAIVGTQSGTLLLFSWGNWGDCSDRFPGHPMSVSSIVKANDSTVYTGSDDGIIRVIGILPNTLLGTLGDNGQNLPIESLKISSDEKWLSTTSHDEYVKIWDASLDGMDNNLFESEAVSSEQSQDSQEESGSDAEIEVAEKVVVKKKSFKDQGKSDFFADLD